MARLTRHELLTRLRAMVTTDATGAAFDRVLQDCADRLHAAGALCGWCEGIEPLPYAGIRCSHCGGVLPPGPWSIRTGSPDHETEWMVVMTDDYEREVRLRFPWMATETEAAAVRDALNALHREPPPLAGEMYDEGLPPYGLLP